jgi:hypothetical protein
MLAQGTDRYRRVVAACSAGGRWLVGAALDWPLYSRGTYWHLPFINAAAPLKRPTGLRNFEHPHP